MPHLWKHDKPVLEELPLLLGRQLHAVRSVEQGMLAEHGAGAESKGSRVVRRQSRSPARTRGSSSRRRHIIHIMRDRNSGQNKIR